MYVAKGQQKKGGSSPLPHISFFLFARRGFLALEAIFFIYPLPEIDEFTSQ